MLIRLVKYNEDQPRAPKGTPDGGKWVASDTTFGFKDKVEAAVKELGGVTDRHGAGDLTDMLAKANKDALIKIIDGLPPEKRPTVLLHPGDEKNGVPTIWLLGWDHDEATDIHDHADSEVGVTVMRGKVFERVYGWSREDGFEDNVKKDGVSAFAHERELREGSTVTLAAPYIHEVGGITKSEKKDITLHAYYPPLKKMGYFSFTDGKLKWDGAWEEGKEPDKARKCGHEKHDPQESSTMKLKIASEEKRIVWAEVYIPNIPDSDGDYMDEDTICEMAYSFMKEKKIASIDIEHNNALVEGAAVVESFIARKNDPDFIPGSWVAGVHIPSDEVWGRIKKGEINGFSIEALVKRTPIEVEIDIPPVVSGVTKTEQDHTHMFYVTYDENGNFKGGRTDTVNGHFHEIKRGTATEDADGHKHLFAHVDVMAKAGSKLIPAEA